MLHTHLGYSDVLGGFAARSLGFPTVSTLHAITWSTGSARDRVKERLQAAGAAALRLPRGRGLRSGAPGVPVAQVGRPGQGADGAQRGPRSACAGEGQASAEELGLSPTDIVVTMVSVLRRDKAGLFPPPSVLTVAGHEIAAAALVGDLATEFPGIRLLVVGDGPDRPAVE